MRGEESVVYRLAWFDSQSFTLYLFNHKDQIYRITADAIELVDNKVRMAFCSLPTCTTSQWIIPDENLGDLFHRLVTEEINFDLSHRLHSWSNECSSITWFYSIFFGSISAVNETDPGFYWAKRFGKSYTL